MSNVFDSKIMRVRLTFVEPLLGTAAADPAIHETYIASKAPDAKTMAEEIEAIGEDGVREKGQTVFPRHPETGEPILFAYQIRGFFKSACGALREIAGTESKKVKAYKKKIDRLITVWVDARDRVSKTKHMIEIQNHGVVGDCQRPLRASTPQGERVAIADSEEVQAGAYVEFDIECLNPSDEKLVREWLSYGIYNGLGQWRNSGKGAFTWEEIDRLS